MIDVREGSEGTSPLDDDRLQFFLKNHELIRTWAALADEVSTAVDEELRHLGGDVQVAATVAGLDLAVAERVAGESFRAPMLHRPTWRSPDADGPDIAVGIGWDGRRVFPTGGWPGVSLPYVGVVASHDTDRGRRIEDAVRPLAIRELVDPRSYRKGSHWIAYRFLKCDDDWYSDLVRWRAWVVDEMIRAWRDCAPVIDRGLSSLSTS